MNNTTILPDGSAFSTAVILSKDEAMALPLKERPICYRLSSKMYHDVWEALGAASMTFNKDAGNEVFNTEQASKIAVDLLFKIANEKEDGQLDAFKAGMRHAAEHCSGMEGDHCGDRIRKAIETLISIPKEP